MTCGSRWGNGPGPVAAKGEVVPQTTFFNNLMTRRASRLTLFSDDRERVITLDGCAVRDIPPPPSRRSPVPPCLASLRWDRACDFLRIEPDGGLERYRRRADAGFVSGVVVF